MEIIKSECSSGGNTRRIIGEIENEDLRNQVKQLYGMLKDIGQGRFLRDMWDYWLLSWVEVALHT